ncbi:MAG: DNA-3-methyladenine glycosylase [Blastocatellia bacterium]|jgi:DNA-3-methyladenine glycosylase II|nr:DNA-3-methyladenine glycosylase [Blastocatellia bacterium]
MKQATGEIARTNSRTFPSRALTLQDISLAAEHLAKADPQLAVLLKHEGPPPLWGRRPNFATLIRIILEQQVSLSSAASMYRRLTNNIKPFTPESIVELGESYLRSLGVTRQKAAYCVLLSHSIVNRDFDLAALRKMGDLEARSELMRLKGVGTWSADIYLLMALRRPDIWPSGDVALVTTVTKLKQLPTRPDAEELLRIAEEWRPFRAVAARMLWQHYLNQRLRRTL